MINFLPIEKILQEKSSLCWAACIVMAKNISPPIFSKSQIDLKDKKNTWLRRSDPIKNSMESDRDYYSRLFNDDILDKIGAKQYQTKEFISTEFIINQVDKGQPIIFSGISYPLINGQAHAILVHGYFFEDNDNVFWLLTVDPLNTSTTIKTAWIYAEMITYNYGVEQHFDYITDFNDGNNRNNNIGVDTMGELNEVLRSYFGLRPRSVVRDCYLIIKYNSNLLKKYFGFNNNRFDIFNGYYYRSVPKELVITGLWHNDKEISSLLFMPVLQEEKFKCELIFAEKMQNVITLIGIQETKGIQDIEELKRVVNGQEEFTVSLNHQKPNYNILCISPMNVLLFEIRMFTITHVPPPWFSPINDYNSANGKLKKAHLYSEEEIQSFLS